MGVVCSVRDLGLQRHVAVKTLAVGDCLGLAPLTGSAPRSPGRAP